MRILGEKESQRNKDSHRQWRHDSPGMHIHTGHEDMPHREWGCDSMGMHILTGNEDVTHWEWGV